MADRNIFAQPPPTRFSQFRLQLDVGGLQLIVSILKVNEPTDPHFGVHGVKYCAAAVLEIKFLQFGITIKLRAFGVN